MRILLTGGGTAGHINPAIAIAEIVKQNSPRAEIAFVGTPHGMENDLIPRAGFPLYHIDVAGFSRSLSYKNLRALWLAAVSPHHAEKILTDFKPDLVIGTGGYVCWPTLRAAAKKGIPTAIHESNAIPGMTVRRLAPFMDAIWLNFEASTAHLPKGCVSPRHIGNPMRRDFISITREAARAQLHLSQNDIFLLSFGGSLGAEALNRSMIDFMKKEAPQLPELVCLHACGSKHYMDCRSVFTDTDRAKIAPYIQKMAIYMSAADIIVCRAGAMTISELALCGKCAILVPSPYVTDNHQYKNAATLAGAGAAMLLEERDLPYNKLQKMTKMLIFDSKKRSALEKEIKKYAKPNANQAIWQEIQLLTR